MRPTLLIATNNYGKVREILDLLGDLSARIVLPHEVGVELNPAETGSTYAENAALKAQAFCAASGLVTLADDSGLEVDALDGEPGIHSARYLPKVGATDADRRKYLLSRLQGKSQPWTAHFHCTLAIALPDRRLLFAEGDCPGEIIANEHGDNGFGYDPIFLVAESGLTMAELPMQEKNRLSHRARAMAVARLLLLDVLTY